MRAVAIAFRLDEIAVERHRLAARCVIVEYVDLAAYDLIPPDRGIVAVADVPRGMHGDRIIDLHFTDAALAFRCDHFAPVIRTGKRSGEVALVLLGVLLRRELSANLLEFLRIDELGFARAQFPQIPALRILARLLAHGPEFVPSLRCAAEHDPALTIRERRADHVAVDARLEVPELIENRAERLRQSDP